MQFKRWFAENGFYQGKYDRPLDTTKYDDDDLPQGEPNPYNYNNPIYDPHETDYYNPYADDRNPENWYDDGRSWDSGSWDDSDDYLRNLENDRWLKDVDPSVYSQEEFERIIKPALLKRTMRSGGGHYISDPKIGARAYGRPVVMSKNKMPRGFHMTNEPSRQRQTLRDRYLDLMGAYLAGEVGEDALSELAALKKKMQSK